jgi:hypothetical protein
VSQALLAAFRRAVSAAPWYRQLLATHGVEPAAIVDRRTFTALCPILTKANSCEGIERLCTDASEDSTGAGIGLHFCYETPRTLDVRRAALQNKELARELFGECPATPRVLEYDERSALVEALDLDDQGYGRMTISLIDQALPMPVLRYQTGYLVRLLDPSRVMLAMWRRGCQLSGPLPSTLLALATREANNGMACGDYAAGEGAALV